MTRKQEIGKEGERIAREFLEKKGYWVIEKNYWKPWGELDVIARAPDTTLVFVEVKTIYTNLTSLSNNSSLFIQPEDNMTSAKIRKTQRAAEGYANSHSQHVTHRGWRIDLVCVTMNDTSFEIRHYENI